MRVPLPSLKFVSGIAGNSPQPVLLEVDPPQSLSKLKDERKFGVYLVSESSSRELARLDQVVFDRGVKPSKKSLAQLLLGHQQAPLIRVRYSSTGRLQQGVTAFLKQAASVRDRNLYFVAVPDGLFTELWSETGSARREARWRKTRFIPSKSKAELPGANYDLVLHLLPPVTVPAELEQTFVGRSLEAHLVRVLIMRAAAGKDPVLILGETGTGKEIVARAIHKYSQHSREKFIPVNCGGIPRELFEAELFGIKRGVATNVGERRGLWEQTGRGTLFLDELGELPPEHQVKILRALDERAIRPIGESNEREVFARIVAATNRELYSIVQQGGFRADLYYRLRVLTIPTPSLRDIPEDLPVMTQFLWKRVTDDESCVLSDDVVDQLRTYSWPGNVRELSGVLKNIHALFGADKIKQQHVRGVFQLLGIQPGAPVSQRATDQMRQHRMECLQHLRRVDEVVRACQVTIEPLFSDGNSRAGDRERASALLQNRASELDLMLLRPLMFHDEVVFALIARLRAKIVRLSAMLEQDLGAAGGFWRDEVSHDFQMATRMVFQEVEEMLTIAV